MPNRAPNRMALILPWVGVIASCLLLVAGFTLLAVDAYKSDADIVLVGLSGLCAFGAAFATLVLSIMAVRSRTTANSLDKPTGVLLVVTGIALVIIALLGALPNYLLGWRVPLGILGGAFIALSVYHFFNIVRYRGGAKE